ncbi:Sua5/YciO/YrdC/YwlC family protein [archaeon]|jgi:L-threonylcarbamoyladenylate synthase|nr:Sua5/YciO/YrdC/YwlC family protein [archaeon]
MIEKLKSEIFIYPTDTIYGLGCDATNEKLVGELREIKNRDDKPLSVIAPSVKWIFDNFEVELELLEKYLPGPYTLLLKKKNVNFLPWISNNELVGVRIPDCEFTQVLQETEVPIVTTSVNLAGEPFALTLDDVDPRIKEKINLIIEGDELSGKPSVLVKDGKELVRK